MRPGSRHARKAARKRGTRRLKNRPRALQAPNEKIADHVRRPAKDKSLARAPHEGRKDRKREDGLDRGHELERDPAQHRAARQRQKKSEVLGVGIGSRFLERLRNRLPNGVKRNRFFLHADGYGSWTISPHT